MRLIFTSKEVKQLASAATSLKAVLGAHDPAWAEAFSKAVGGFEAATVDQFLDNMSKNTTKSPVVFNPQHDTLVVTVGEEASGKMLPIVITLGMQVAHAVIGVIATLRPLVVGLTKLTEFGARPLGELSVAWNDWIKSGPSK